MLFNYHFLTTNNPLTKVYGLSRSLLAVSLFITLAFNSVDTLFDRTIFDLYIGNNYLNAINIFSLFGYENLAIARLVCLLVLVLVIWGVYPRYTGILHWWISFSFVNISSIVEGGDQVNAILSLLFIPLTLLDSRKNHWAPAQEIGWTTRVISNNLLVLIQIQACFVYLHSAIEKLYKLDEWVQGVAIYYFFNDKLFGIPDWLNYLLSPLIESKLVFLLSWGVIAFELCLFGAIFMSKEARKKWLIPGIVFHLLIAVLFGLVSFFFSMCGLLCIYLLASDASLKTRRYDFFGKTVFRKLG